MATKAVGSFIRERRIRRKMSQLQLAALSGIRRDYISSIELGRIEVVYPQTANRLREALGFDGWEFLEAMGYETNVRPELPEHTRELVQAVRRLSPGQQDALLGLLSAFELPPAFTKGD